MVTPEKTKGNGLPKYKGTRYTQTMTELEQLKETFERCGIRPNRALGQNFLVDAEALDAIAAACCVSDADVLEIGPGLGALTKRLLTRAARVVAVEKDAVLAGILHKTVPDENLKVVIGDALKAEPKDYFSGAYHVVGNLPYYITTPLAERYLLKSPVSMTFLVQKEAGERFFAGPNERVYGPLSVMAQTFYRPERVISVPRSSFYPQPEVDSAVVRLAPKAQEQAPVPAAAREPFYRFLNRAFAMRRKTLVNNFKDVSTLPDALRALSINPAVRAEALPPEMLFELFLRVKD